MAVPLHAQERGRVRITSSRGIGDRCERTRINGHFWHRKCDSITQGAVSRARWRLCGEETEMRNKEARQLARGETIRPLPSAIGYGRRTRRYAHIVAYVGGPAFSPWIVTTDGVQFAPWEVERAQTAARAPERSTRPAAGR